MTAEENDLGLEDGPEEGPILLPPGAACKNCHYSSVIRIGQTIQTSRICRRFPPGPYFMPSPQGGALLSSPSIVPDDYACFEYDERVKEVIPTALG